MGPNGHRVIQLRGTNGSGKSYTVHALLAAFQHEPILGEPLTERVRDLQPGERVLGYRVALPGDGPALYICGTYENQCGGCDSIKTQDEIQARVRHFAARGHVLFEGYIFSDIFSRWEAMAREDFPGRMTFAFMDTPRDLCEARVRARRAEKRAGRLAQRGLFAEDEPEDDYSPHNLNRAFKSGERCRRKMLAAGLDVLDVDHTAEPPYGWVLYLLGVTAWGAVDE